MASTIEGGCLCGGVRYRLHVRPKQGSDCHCEDCRRASAAPYVTWCSVPSKAIEVLSGELRRVSYADRLRSFASCCGTPLFIQDEVGSEWIDVTVASLEAFSSLLRRKARRLGSSFTHGSLFCPYRDLRVKGTRRCSQRLRRRRSLDVQRS